MVSSIFGIYHPDMCGRLSLKLWSSCRFKLIQSPTSFPGSPITFFFKYLFMNHHSFLNKGFDSHSSQGFTNFFSNNLCWLTSSPLHVWNCVQKLRWWRTRWWDVSEVLYKLLQMSSTKNRLPPCHEAKKSHRIWLAWKEGPPYMEQLMDFLIVVWGAYII